jgi:hypothetical protein
MLFIHGWHDYNCFASLAGAGYPCGYCLDNSMQSMAVSS